MNSPHLLQPPFFPAYPSAQTVQSLPRTGWISTLLLQGHGSCYCRATEKATTWLNDYSRAVLLVALLAKIGTVPAGGGVQLEVAEAGCRRRASEDIDVAWPSARLSFCCTPSHFSRHLSGQRGGVGEMTVLPTANVAGSLQLGRGVRQTIAR